MFHGRAGRLSYNLRRKGHDMAKVLMHDKFESLRPGPIREKVDGAFREMHAQPASPDDNLGGWSRRAGGWGLPHETWFVVDSDKGRFIESRVTANCADNASLAKGDHDWRDVKVESRGMLLPKGEGWGGPAGIIFRFLDSQRYYAAFIDEDGLAKIAMRLYSSWDLLASSPVNVSEGEWFDIKVEVKGPRIKAKIADAKLEAGHGDLTHGCAGFIGARPCRFGPIKVTAVGKEAERLAKQKKADTKRLAARRKKYGAPVAWKKYDTKGFGSGRRIRLGDLTGDGGLDFLLLQIDSVRDRGIGCMTAMSHEGEILWRKGTPHDAPEQEASADTPAQIHDIDGDGRNEVVCVFQRELIVLDGATGEIKQKAELPPMSPYPEEFKLNVPHWGAGFSDDGPRVHASAIQFADLAGRGAKRDILLQDHYHQLIAMSPDLKELWRTVNVIGHFATSYDFDKDGRDDVLAGFRHLSPDGKIVGRVILQDHQDAIYAGPLDLEGRGPDKILMAAGEDGVLLLTPDYDIRLREMGHVQRLSVGRFREDVPGLCVGIVIYHGNPGIVSLFDSTMKRLWTKDFPVVGATLQPVNWDGSGVELMFWSGIRKSQGVEGGLLDGEGELVVPMPDDGGPGFCCFAYDIDGDGLDELMVWDYERIWIYHTDRDAPSGRRYRPIRPPLFNLSNFQSYWSRPRWE